MNEDNSAMRNILLKAEMKRISEKLMKKELCAIYEFNYNYYMNCISNRNQPSQKMADKLVEYLQTPTKQVHEKVFATREAETEFHDKIEISGQYVIDSIKELKSNNMSILSPLETNKLVEFAIAKEYESQWDDTLGDDYKDKVNDIEKKIKNLRKAILELDENDKDDSYIEEIGKLELKLNDLREEKEMKYKLFIKDLVSNLK